MLDAGYWGLDTGNLILDTGCWMLDAEPGKKQITKNKKISMTESGNPK